jgi:thiol-disulfide isomerase/thioredoxin
LSRFHSTRSAARLAGLVLGCLTLARGTLAPGAAPAPIGRADVKTILTEVRKPGAKAVLVNVWATWCDPCRAEMPALLRFFRAHAGQGLRLVLISADDESDRGKVADFLTSQGVDFPTWMKQGDDMRFIDGLDPRWSGALPASFMFDGHGKLQRRWYGEVKPEALDQVWKRLSPRPQGGTP